jgi:hypothetical protein
MAQTIAEQDVEQGYLHYARWLLRRCLEQKHGKVSKPLLDRITACDDTQRLEQAISEAMRLANPEDLEL